MTDTGTIATDRARARLEIKLKRSYRTARKELEEKLEAYAKQFSKTDAEMRLKLDRDEITPAQYKNWKKVAVFRGDQWRTLIKQSTAILSDTNEAALRMVNNDRLGVFAINANYQSYQICRDTGMDLAFAVYDEDSVRHLMKDNPDLLPTKYLDKRKDGAWITGQINTAVTQSIIQGESIPATALRIAKQTGETNEKAMVRFARTAMTSAQNAGRMESLHRATDMGISVKKVWLATLDRRTRDSHRHLDGQTKDIDEPFISDFGKIMFPGDPEAHPGDTFNCRCTLTYEYEGYPSQNAERREEGGGLIEDTTYDEWVKGKDFYRPPKKKTEETETDKQEENKTEVSYTKDEENSVEWYVSGEGQWINQYLRNPAEFGELSEYEKEQLQLLDSATQKQEITDNKLYRAVDAQAVFGKMSDMDFDNLKGAVIYGDKSRMSQAALEKAQRMLGKEVTEKGFMSTTRDMDIAAEWNGYTGSTKDIMLVMKVPDGIHGFDVEKRFEVEGEEQREVLLQRGLAYKVNSIGKQETEEGTVIVVEVEIIKKKRSGNQ